MSQLSSTIAPCYYALVECSSTTDKKSGESNKTTDKGSGVSTTSGSSAGIVAVVVGSLLAVLLVVTIVIIILIVLLKRKDKNLKPTGSNANSTHASPQLPTSPPAGTGASNVTLALGNPTYQPTHFRPAQTEAINMEV